MEPARYRPFIDALRRDSRIEVLVLAEEAEARRPAAQPGEHRRQALPAWRTRILGRAPAFARKGLAWLAEVVPPPSGSTWRRPPATPTG
ncbi:hypothetical protein P4233_13820 [Pseudomonas aeruginosa]|nr:hypothetical protein [Pseudomonas aeruginosa]